MNRYEFMEQLSNLLNDLPEEEKNEAIRYYEDYFEDAGVFEEDRIIKELGSPERVAKQIKGNLDTKVAKEAGEYTERGYHNQFEEEKSQNITIAYQKEENTNSAREESNYYENATTSNAPKKDTSKNVLLIALVICSFPIWIGFVAGAFGLVIGLFGGLFGLVVGLGGGFFGLLVASIVLFITGICKLFISAPIGCIMIGTAFLLGALAIVFFLGCKALALKAIPAIIRGITSVGSRLFNKRGRVSA